MIDAFVDKYGSMFRDIVKKSMRNDLKKIVDEAKGKQVIQFRIKFGDYLSLLLKK